jgi:hypothetical protein
MKSFRLFLLVTLLLSPFSGAVAQSTIYNDYAQEAGDALMIYRGRKAIHYAFQFNGTFYWESPQFLMGDVVYNSKKYEGLMLNIDANLQQVQVRHPVSAITVALNTSYLTSFNIGEKRFIGRDGGIYEIIYDGPITLLRQITKTLMRDIHLRNGESIGYYDPNFKENVFYYFKYNSTLYCLKDEILTPVRRERDILRLFPDRKNEIKAFVKRSKVSPRRNFEEYCIKVLSYAESTLK